MADEDVFAMLLGLQSWTDVSVEIDEDTLRAVASGELPAQSLRPVAILVPHLPEHITRLELTVHTSSGLRLLAGPTEPWRAYDQAQVRLWAARQALEQAAAGYPACIKPLRQLHGFARRVQDQDLASGLRELIAYARWAPSKCSRHSTAGRGFPLSALAMVRQGWKGGRRRRKLAASAPEPS